MPGHRLPRTHEDARFEPALDAAGKPVTSYYTTAIIYQTRRRNGNW